jgi:hypothetical protein
VKAGQIGYPQAAAHERLHRGHEETVSRVVQLSREPTVVGSSLVREKAGLEQKEPTLVNLRMHLTGAAFPVERVVRPSIAPQGVEVDNRESAIGLFRHCYAQCPPPVMNEVVRIKELLPCPIQRSRSYLPNGMTHCMGSCAVEFGGHGQTVWG